ncbi:hypothetical protein B0J11DRAFT_504654 [Dendryphion nanum]|uniref:Uncharacterized protein n=1 Tax=Dendryphion nanum TaxID=256645 RepID=A0A9P9DYM3_9PLEO|nr:hypothetical protein B0J11DRAFT_504654 [Dendryphion nanum]
MWLLVRTIERLLLELLILYAYKASNGDKYTFWATSNGDAKRVKEYGVQGQDVFNKKDANPLYISPLSIASGRGHTDVVILLLKAAAHSATELTNEPGRAMKRAQARKFADIKKLLREIREDERIKRTNFVTAGKKKMEIVVVTRR